MAGYSVDIPCFARNSACCPCLARAAGIAVGARVVAHLEVAKAALVAAVVAHLEVAEVALVAQAAARGRVADWREIVVAAVSQAAAAYMAAEQPERTVQAEARAAVLPPEAVAYFLPAGHIASHNIPVAHPVSVVAVAVAALRFPRCLLSLSAS